MVMDDAARSGLTAEQVRDVIAKLASPDVVDSPFGQLDFFDGVPTPDTVSRIYDALDLMRGIDVFLNCVRLSGAASRRRTDARSVRSVAEDKKR
jgi:hypothetical protein